VGSQAPWSSPGAAVAASFATCCIAYLGACESRLIASAQAIFACHCDQAGHMQSSYFIWLNRNKETVPLDPEGDRREPKPFLWAGHKVSRNTLARASKLCIMGSQSRDARAAVPEPGDLFGVRLSGEEHHMNVWPMVGQHRDDSLHELGPE
jgi:hypothetical protein